MTKPTLTTTVISDLAWQQLTDMDAPANSPIASTVAGVAPVQSWEETDQVLPDIGQVDNELLAAAGLSNTILISVKTEEVLKTITVSIGANGNWFVGGVDTGVAAQGTNEASIARPTGVYGAASVFHVGNTLTIGAGLMYCVKEGQNFFTMQTTAELNISIDASTTFVTIDRTGTVRTYSSGINLWTIPESQALVALVIDTDGTVSSFAVPTVHNAMLMASAVIPYSRGATEAASTATLQATIASQFASQAHQSADAAEAAKVITQADAAITTTNAQLAEQYKTDAQAAATSAHQFADFADADRVATAADRAQVATDKAAVAADRSTVATDKGIVASDKAITLGYKNDAAASKNLAAEYAIKPENSVITGTVSDYSALHWAQKAQQWAQAVSSALVWKGQWSAESNTAPPTPAVGTGAHFYRISAAGTINSVTYEVGDYIHWDTVSLSWFKIDGTDAVMTVNGVSPDGGNVSITTITGNAGTATKLATARTIGGVSFDGSANINLPGVNAAGNQSTTGNAATATRLATARTIGGVSFNGTANINLPGVNAAGTQDTSGNAATATRLATARLIAGKSFDGTADITLAASDVSAVPATGGTVSGVLGVTGELQLVGYSAGDMADIVWIAPDGTERGRLWIGGTIGADNSLTWRSGASGAFLKIYHEGNKPTAADVGAVACNASGVVNQAVDFKACRGIYTGSSVTPLELGHGESTPKTFYVDIHTDTSADFNYRWTYAHGASGVQFSGTGDFSDIYIRSDKRLKTKLTKIEGSLDKVRRLTGYEFDKAASLGSDVVRREVGLLADDVQVVLPYAVRESADEEAIKTISPSALIALLVEAIKELSEKVKELEHGRT